MLNFSAASMTETPKYLQELRLESKDLKCLDPSHNLIEDVFPIIWHGEESLSKDDESKNELIDDNGITSPKFGRFDLAINKKCGQSSTYLDACNHAIDGNLVTFSHTGHTGFSDGVNYGTSKPYWWVDLGNTYKVRRVDVYNRLTSGHRLHNLDVTAGKSLSVMSLCDHYIGRAKNGELIILVCRQPIEARYVKLQIMEENTADNYLQLAAVEVYE